ncbi:MAG: hypothetical protein JW800_08170 [Candidatus Omnitrophica bacterium]|nr:hypothetical protein [Candidatus Omnitrophota bacterium]
MLTRKPCVEYNIYLGDRMANIQWILFSKNRTLQAKSCLTSLKSLSDVKDEDIAVLYVDSEKISYSRLLEQFRCTFKKQVNFYKDLTDIVLSRERPYIAFMVDDLIFRDRLSAYEISEVMNRCSDLDCFSLRLGKNIVDGRSPVFDRVGGNTISWKTSPGLGASWNYFWELSGSVYRRHTVTEYFKRLEESQITFPNPLEFIYYKMVPNFYIGSKSLFRTLIYPQYWFWRMFCPQKMVRRIACYEKSRAFTQGINLVAGRKIDYDTYAQPEKLHELFLQGYTIDFDCLKDVKNTRPNAGRQYLRIVGPHGEVHPLSVYPKDERSCKVR